MAVKSAREMPALFGIPERRSVKLPKRTPWRKPNPPSFFFLSFFFQFLLLFFLKKKYSLKKIFCLDNYQIPSYLFQAKKKKKSPKIHRVVNFV